MISYRVITSALFGKNFEIFMGQLPYEMPDGSVAQKSAMEFFFALVNEHTDAYFNYLTNMMPFLNTKNLINPFKRNYKNCNTYHKAIKRYLETGTDENSVYRRVQKEIDVTDHKIFLDLLNYLFAGFATVGYSTCSMIYQLKKNPEKLAKLRQELKENGLDKPESYKNLNKDQICDLDYLNMCIKEGLRIDCSATASVSYEALQDVQICGVDIPKGEILLIDILAMHFNEEEWHTPNEFIPERFDPESKFFYKPGTEKEMRSPYAYTPFGLNVRNCPGQAIAKIEMKVIVAYLMTMMDYEVDTNTLRNPFAKFGISSQLELPIKITKVHC